MCATRLAEHLATEANAGLFKVKTFGHSASTTKITLLPASKILPVAGMAAAAPFILAFMFPVVDAMPLERRGNATGDLEGSTQLGPLALPFWAYILIIGKERQ